MIILAATLNLVAAILFTLNGEIAISFVFMVLGLLIANSGY